MVNIFGGITGIYGGSITANAWNGNNANRPVTSNSEAQAGLTNATVNKVNAGSNFLRPGDRDRHRHLPVGEVTGSDPGLQPNPPSAP